MRLPDGFSSAGVSCGIKQPPGLDLGLIACDRPFSWAGTFTQNAAAAAPVNWCKRLLDRPARALVVNSGNANACTGRSGGKAVVAIAEAAAGTVGCGPDEVLVASTGVIGVPLPVSKVEAGVAAAGGALGLDAGPFSRSILTTDTVTKTATVSVGPATVTGVAKGAAMLAPNMATMLAFVTTDAQAGPGELASCLGPAVERTFNRISLDGCESTNDSVFLLAAGTAGPIDPERLGEAVARVCSSLAEQMAADAEGATKVVTIEVRGAADERAAAALGRAVAGSSLWRAAAGGADPNWGRVLSALGSCDRSLDLGLVSVAVGGETLFAGGEPLGDPERAAAGMTAERFDVTCRVGEGPGSARVLSADLTEEYVKLNACGTT